MVLDTSQIQLFDPPNGRSLAQRATDRSRDGPAHGPLHWRARAPAPVVPARSPLLAAPRRRTRRRRGGAQGPLRVPGHDGDGAFTEEPSIPRRRRDGGHGRTGVERLRLAVYWDQAQPDPTVAPDFAATERIVGAAARRGLRRVPDDRRAPDRGRARTLGTRGRRPPTRPLTATSPARSPRASAAAAPSGRASPSCPRAGARLPDLERAGGLRAGLSLRLLGRPGRALPGALRRHAARVAGASSRPTPRRDRPGRPLRQAWKTLPELITAGAAACSTSTR